MALEKMFLAKLICDMALRHGPEKIALQSNSAAWPCGMASERLPLAKPLCDTSLRHGRRRIAYFAAWSGGTATGKFASHRATLRRSPAAWPQKTASHRATLRHGPAAWPQKTVSHRGCFSQSHSAARPSGMAPENSLSQSHSVAPSPRKLLFPSQVLVMAMVMTVMAVTYRKQIIIF